MFSAVVSQEEGSGLEPAGWLFGPGAGWHRGRVCVGTHDMSVRLIGDSKMP